MPFVHIISFFIAIFSVVYSRPLAINNGALDLEQEQFLPIVIWHGMGDSCCSEYSIGSITSYIQRKLPNIFVHSIATGKSLTEDVLSSYYGNVNDQIDEIWHELCSIKQLQDGFIGLGFSQGGQFLRAMVQRYQHHKGPRMHSLVTIGSQHQGVQEVPGCFEPSFNSTPTSWGCQLMQELLGYGAYLSWIQSSIVQAQYFKDPYRIEAYYQHSIFLADINAESFGTKPTDRKYQIYKENLSSLHKFVLFMFDNDITVVPKESSHFGYFDGISLIPLKESLIYKEDWIGLLELDKRGRLVFEHAPGFHMQFTMDWFEKHVLKPYLMVTEKHEDIGYTVM